MSDERLALIVALFGAAPIGMVALDPEGRVSVANAMLEHMFGYAPGELLGQPLEVLIAEDARDLQTLDRHGDGHSPWMRPLGHGMEVLGRHKHGHAFPIEAGLSYLKLDDQVVPIAFVTDITQRRQVEEENQRLLREAQAAQAAAEAARRRQVFLAEASQLLASSLDYQTTLGNLIRMAIPFLGDCCTVDLLVDAHVRRVSAAHVIPEKEALVHKMRWYQPSLDESQPLPTVLRTGQALLISEVNGTLLESAAYHQTHLRLLRQVGVSSAIMAPIKTRERVLGVLSMFITESDRRYNDDDLALAQELALLAAQAIECY